MFLEPKLALYVSSSAGRTLAGQMALFLSPASAGLFFGQAMNQPVSEAPVVTHHLGALIAFVTLLGINLAGISIFFGWW
jgi:hypothetical protein